MLSLRLLLIFTTFTIVLFQRIDVKVTKYEKLTVKISFIFLALVFSEGEKERMRFRRYTRLLKNFKAVFKSLKYLFINSDIFLDASRELYGYAENKPTIDLSLHFSLFRLIISLLIFLYYTVKHKVKRGIKNV